MSKRDAQKNPTEENRSEEGEYINKERARPTQAPVHL
jgi:hypothetical protein